MTDKQYLKADSIVFPTVLVVMIGIALNMLGLASQGGAGVPSNIAMLTSMIGTLLVVLVYLKLKGKPNCGTIMIAIAGAVSARPIALLPGGIMIGVSALMPLVASRIVQFNAKEKAIIEEAKNTDEEIEAANQKHLEDPAALVLAAERRLKPLENEYMALRKKIQDAIPNNADRVWISVEDHQRLIMALESGRADTLEEAMEYSSKINKMQFDQRMKEINRNFNHFMDTMRMKDVEEQKRRELERAKSGEEKSKAELSETRRLINEMRSKYNVN